MQNSFQTPLRIITWQKCVFHPPEDYYNHCIAKQAHFGMGTSHALKYLRYFQFESSCQDNVEIYI